MLSTSIRYSVLVAAALVLLGCGGGGGSGTVSTSLAEEVNSPAEPAPAPADPAPLPAEPDPISLVPALAGFDVVSEDAWDETAVRKVLHTFAYGGHATDQQIATWAKMSPQAAIVQMLTFDEHNPLLSPVTAQNFDALDTRSGTLRELSAFWSSNDPANGFREEDRWKYEIFISGLMDRVWLAAATSRGLNPFRQNIGLWETNYHMAVHRASVSKTQIIGYYDEIMNSLERGDPYQEVLLGAALSPAVAVQYAHRLNIYSNDRCFCNEDFAREYFQLFFGILGEDDPFYHETVTIKNMARALTDMTVGVSPIEGAGWDDSIVFGAAQHFPGPLEIMFASIGGSRADERIVELSQIAINHSESLDNLPVIIIGGLADDNLTEAKKTLVRQAWSSMPQKNLIDFLRAYVISTLFHDKNRIRYLTSVDRHLTIANQVILNNQETYLGFYNSSHYELEDVRVFQPTHVVFGGQTGKEAADSASVFRSNYNRVAENPWRYMNAGADEATQGWRKDWASVAPRDAGGGYVVSEIAEWLWDRFIADGLVNFGTLERAHIYALLARGLDIAYVADPNDPDRVITSADLMAVSALSNLYNQLAGEAIALDSPDIAARRVANERVGQAINFIVATPFMFAEMGR